MNKEHKMFDSPTETGATRTPRKATDTTARPVNVRKSLTEIAGSEYVDRVCAARAFLTGTSSDELKREANKSIEFFPPSFQSRCDELLGNVGSRVCEPFDRSTRGAATSSFAEATHPAMAPLSGFGFIRVGEDGRAYLTSKSEHYHASLGHGFPGYEIVDVAERLGISNATHNNTRGNITRVLEQELIRIANGVAPGDDDALHAVLASEEPRVLNRVINLETGSLAVEAGLKMMLARFYRLSASAPRPRYAGRVPVFLVIGDLQGNLTANYHGTTILTQVMRGMWPELREAARNQEIFHIEPVAINDIGSLRRAIERYDEGRYKIAGFFHEIVLMNYGAIRLDAGYLREAYELCDARDIPTLVDEIQTCSWSPKLFLFREYGLRPSFVAIGKGMPGGNTPASRIITTAAMDNLDQFGALVTNGQEERAALYYLVTIEFVQANAAYVEFVGDYYQRSLARLAERYPRLIRETQGLRHLASLYFFDQDSCNAFVGRLNEQCIDISSQTYKEESPPTALTKLPIIASVQMVDFLIERMDQALASA